MSGQERAGRPAPGRSPKVPTPRVALGKGGKKEQMRLRSNSKLLADFMSANSQTDIQSEAENILKTKGRKRAFSKNEAENILKIKNLPKFI